MATSLRPPPIPSPYRARARNGLTPSPLSTDDSPPEYSSSPAGSSAAQATNNPRPRSSRVRRRVSYDHDHDHDHDYHARYSHPIPLRLVSIETQTDHRPSAPHATCDRLAALTVRLDDAQLAVIALRRALDSPDLSDRTVPVEGSPGATITAGTTTPRRVDRVRVLGQLADLESRFVPVHVLVDRFQVLRRDMAGLGPPSP